MRALTLTQPIARAYLAGVLLGDAWLTTELGLRCKDRDFSEAFARALVVGFGVDFPPRVDERGYWLIRRGNASGRFNLLRDLEPESRDERAAWLRGMFDSEGNAQFRRMPGGPQCYGRRIAFYSTNTITMHRTAEHLTALGIPTRLSATSNSAGHKGSKVVYELHVSMSRDAVIRFGTLVGSSIGRKCGALFAMAISYQDVSEHARKAQAIGAANRRARKEAVCAL